MRLDFRPLTEVDARAILAWRYRPPYSFYDPEPHDFAGMLEPENAYYAVTSERGGLVGFCCFGPDARVRGGTYRDEPDVLDVGAGRRPNLTGQGSGTAFIEAIVGVAEDYFGPATVRATVAAFNLRALRACERAGFQSTGHFVGETSRGQHEFVILERQAFAASQT